MTKALAENTRQQFGQQDQSQEGNTTTETIIRIIRDAYERNGITLAAIAQASKIAKQLVGYTRQEFYAVMKSALKVDIFLPDPNLQRLLQEWTVENVRLIKSIPEAYFGNLQGIVSRGLQQGLMTSDIAAEIQDLYAVTSSRAQLIAVDQIGKLNGLISQERQTAAGIRFYEWSTSRDARVRELHQRREGKFFSWPGTGAEGTRYKGQTVNPPPAGGPPGYPIRCRCVALPVIDTDILDGVFTSAQTLPRREVI